MYKTFQYRIKDSNNKLRENLLDEGHAVNRIWNNANELQKKALVEESNWPSSFDLDKETSGWCKPLALHSTTVQSVNNEYTTRRKQFKKPCLNWRSNRKSLTWIPFKKSALRFNRESGQVKFNKLEFDLFYSRPLIGEIKSGSITCDSRRRFYLNVVCKIEEGQEVGELELDGSSSIGIDLGLKSLVTTSEEEIVKTPRYFRQQQNRLAKAQRAKKKKQVRNIHAKIKNQRKDFSHKLSTSLVNSYDFIFVGDVSSKDIIKASTQTKGMAKSVNDASWFQLKTFLSYKALAKGKVYQEVSEKYSTQTCSECSTISPASPKGRAGLNIREWVCPICLTRHDRDVNAARNILRSGHRSLLEKPLVTN